SQGIKQRFKPHHPQQHAADSNEAHTLTITKHPVKFSKNTPTPAPALISNAEPLVKRNPCNLPGPIFVVLPGVWPTGDNCHRIGFTEDFPRACQAQADVTTDFR
ncbi:MAG: hypothetical protein ACRD0P_25140, partial [Stackebrandtia sp.]